MRATKDYLAAVAVVEMKFEYFYKQSAMFEDPREADSLPDILSSARSLPIPTCFYLVEIYHVEFKGVVHQQSQTAACSQ